MFRYTDAKIPNIILFGYMLLMVIGGTYLILHDNIIGVLLYAHCFVLMAYVAHDCMHDSLFVSEKVNDYIGIFFAGLIGGAYTPYKELKQKHLMHHSFRVDFVQMDFRIWMESHPVVKKIVYAMHRVYLPGAEILCHMLTIASPWMFDNLKDRRQFVIDIALGRLCFYLGLSIISWKLVFAYLAARVIAMQILALIDCHQHTFKTIDIDTKPGDIVKMEGYSKSKQYEDEHTKSNLISTRFPWLNLLLLNFTYHNVHHKFPDAPWHQLPEKHKQFYEINTCVIKFKDVLYNFHKHRLTRLQLRQDIDHSKYNEVGVAGASFLSWV